MNKVKLLLRFQGRERKNRTFSRTTIMMAMNRTVNYSLLLQYLGESIAVVGATGMDGQRGRLVHGDESTAFPDEGDSSPHTWLVPMGEVGKGVRVAEDVVFFYASFINGHQARGDGVAPVLESVAAPKLGGQYLYQLPPQPSPLGEGAELVHIGNHSTKHILIRRVRLVVFKFIVARSSH